MRTLHKKKALRCRKNPLVNFHNLKVKKNGQKRPTKKEISTYRTGSWRGGKGIKVLYALKKRKGPRGGRSVIVSMRFPASRWTLSAAKRYALDHDFTIVKAEAAKKATKKKTTKKRSTKKATKKKTTKKRSTKKTPKKKTKCKKCKKPIRQSKGPGRPRIYHRRCAA